MGADSSKQGGKVLSTKPAPPVHQQQEPPYPGPAAQYQFVNTQVMISTQLTFSFSQSPMVTSNIDQYYPALAAQYQEGYRLLSFYKIPGQQQHQGIFNPSVAMGFQGIFCRYPSVPPRERWQLRIEKSVLQLQRVYTGIISFSNNQTIMSDTSHLLQSIARNTQDGGRLVCIEMTGQQQQQNFSMAMRGVSPMMGVDLFFEVPETPTPEKYVYNCVSVPIGVTIQMGFRPVPQVHCDWIGALAQNLGQGWRLIEIFMDMTTHTQAHGFSGQSTLNSMWMFEKPVSRMNDPRPVYQGTVVDHQIQIKAGFGGSRTSANWEPVIQDMGNKGWELACILETPDTKLVGMTTVVQTCKLFFQRPLLPQQGFQAAAPPPYDAAVGGQGYDQGQGHGGAALPSPPAGFNVATPPPPEKMGY